MSYAAPVSQLLLLLFWFLFSSAVRWVFVEDDSSAPGTLGELYGKFGQYSLAFFPWDRAYSIAWFVVCTLVVLMSIARIALDNTWSGSERQALDGVSTSDALVIVSLLLLALWYVPAIQIARPARTGIVSAFAATMLLCAATVTAVVGVAAYDPWGRKSVAVLLFGELAWGTYAGLLVYSLVASFGSLIERYRFEPDPNWLMEKIVIPHKNMLEYTNMARHWNDDYAGAQTRYERPMPGRKSLPKPYDPLQTVNTPKNKSAYDKSSKRQAFKNTQDDMNSSGIFDQDKQVHYEQWSTTAFKRWKGTFVRNFYAESPLSEADKELGDDSQSHYSQHSSIQMTSGQDELTNGVLIQAFLVGVIAVVSRSPTMPLLPLVAFNNLIPDDEGPRLLGSVAMVLASGAGLALGIVRWAEA